MNEPSAFLGGALTVGYLVLGLFFLKFWKRTRDPLFITFASAFALMAANQLAVSASGSYDLDIGWTYVLRLLAFVLIIVAIVRKNIETGRDRLPGRPSASVAADEGRQK
jgi:peptidoglycan/LPS O-acetylase OafA/YrhL